MYTFELVGPDWTSAEPGLTSGLDPVVLDPVQNCRPYGTRPEDRVGQNRLSSQQSEKFWLMFNPGQTEQIGEPGLGPTACQRNQDGITCSAAESASPTRYRGWEPGPVQTAGPLQVKRLQH